MLSKRVSRSNLCSQKQRHIQEIKVLERYGLAGTRGEMVSKTDKRGLGARHRCGYKQQLTKHRTCPLEVHFQWAQSFKKCIEI